MATTFEDFTTEEGILTAEDGHELFTKTWKPSSAVKAQLVFVHGFADHVESQGILFPALASHGITVYTFDQRGWGRSAKTKAAQGLTGTTTQVMSDITTFIKAVPRKSGLPLFLMGHSMGGQEILVYAATGPIDVVHNIRGFIAEAPFVALHPSTKPWKLTVVLGRLAGKLLPHVHMAQNLQPSALSRNPEVGKRFKNDPLCYETGTLEGLAGMLDRAGELEGGRINISADRGEGGHARLLVAHGTADAICGFEATKQWYERQTKVQDKQLIDYDGWYHKLHEEPNGDDAKFCKDVVKWILDRAGPLKGGVAGSERAKL